MYMEYFLPGKTYIKLYADDAIKWVKTKHKVSILPRQGEVLLENKTFDSFLFTAWICKDCQKVLIDYSDKNFHEGE